MSVDSEAPLHILFVCTGNICRSPTAERLAAAHASAMGIPNFTASSAGTAAVIEHPMHADAAVVLEGLGGDSSGFVARQLTAKIAASADLILGMTARHRDQVLELCPQKLNRTFVLSEAARLASDFGAESIRDLAGLRTRLGPDERPDIADPIGRDTEVFQAVGSQIAELLPPIIELCRRS